MTLNVTDNTGSPLGTNVGRFLKLIKPIGDERRSNPVMRMLVTSWDSLRNPNTTVGYFGFPHWGIFEPLIPSSALWPLGDLWPSLLPPVAPALR